MAKIGEKTLGGLIRLLDRFRPVLAGTFPLGLQVGGSDIDILCEVPNLESFEAFAVDNPAWFGEATIRRATHLTPEACVIHLELSGFDVELFGQPLSVFRQSAFRHMVIEGRLLAMGGDRLANRVRSLKANGMKTEPAFADVLGLRGDPYVALLELESVSNASLARLLAPLMRD